MQDAAKRRFYSKNKAWVNPKNLKVAPHKIYNIKVENK